MFLDRLFASSPEPNREWQADVGASGWMGTDSGERVSVDASLRLSALYRCVQIITDDMMSLPWGVYEKQEGKRVRRHDHPVDYLISTEPNPEMDAGTFVKTMQVHRELKGNAYAEIIRNRIGDPVALWLIDPDMIRPDRTPGGALYYRYHTPAGSEKPIKPENILHIKGLSFDGITGMSVLAYARETVGGGLAQQKTSNSIFRNGLKPSAVFSHPNQLSDIAERNIRSSIASMYSGAGNTGRPILLQEGMKVEKWAITPEEAQFLDSRKFTIEEIARWFGIKAYKLGLMDRETHSNIFQNAKEHIEECIMPRCIAWEKEVKRKLFRPDERGALYTKFDFNAMLRGSPSERAEFYTRMRDLGALDIDEIRAKEDLDELPDGLGRTRLVPLNMIPLDKVQDAAAQKQAQGQQSKRSSAVHESTVAIIAEVVDRTKRKEAKASENGKADDEFYRKVSAELYENLTKTVENACAIVGLVYDDGALAQACADYAKSRGGIGSIEFAIAIMKEMPCIGQ
ncbi:MAG: phage portal protein [Chlorobiaceae bacterium]|nr:phage portal protein [Chlorobiaceae bacterium]